MQGLRVWFVFAAFLACSQQLYAEGLPSVADITVHRIGQAITLVDRHGVQSSEVEIHSPGATFLKLHFSDFRLPDGIVVEVSDPAGRERYRYSANHKDARTFDPKVGDDGSNSFSAMSISDDTVRVRLLGDLSLLADGKHALRISYRLEGLSARNTLQSAPGSSVESSCGVDERRDSVCWAQNEPRAYNRSRPVGKVLTSTGIVCTAWRVGPQNRIFTAEHCIANQADVSAAEVWFNFEADQCGGNATGALVKVSGATLLAVNETLDFALFTVSGFESLSGFGYLGLEVRQAIHGERIYIPQHGYGQPKQLAFSSDMNPSGLCEIDDVDHDGYGSRTDVGYYCDTVSSSSGAPVISAGTGRAIALHHLGGCVNSGAKMSLIWPLVAQHFGNVIPAGDREPTLQNRPPEASIRLACRGLDCSISGAGSRDADGTVVDYRWDFGDGKTGTGANVQHRYPVAGSYRIKLAVTDNRGAIAETTQSIRIGAATRPPPLVIKPGR